MIGRFRLLRIGATLGCAVAALGAFLSAMPALSAPPPHADPALHAWFSSLRQPGNGVSCCDVSDGRAAPYRPYTGSDPTIALEAEVIKDADHFPNADKTHWVPVPSSKVLAHVSNPTGEAILFWTPYGAPGGTVYCFVLPTGS